MKLQWRLILIGFGVLLAVALLIDFNRRLEELNNLSMSLKAVQADGTAIMKTQEALVTQVAYATSDDAVEKWAYQNKWVRAGEHLVQPVDEGGVTATPEPSSVTQKENLPNWRTWWELFFGAN